MPRRTSRLGTNEGPSEATRIRRIEKRKVRNLPTASRDPKPRGRRKRQHTSQNLEVENDRRGPLPPLIHSYAQSAAGRAMAAAGPQALCEQITILLMLATAR